MAKEQRLVFIFKKTKSGKLAVECKLFPQMPKTEEEFRELPMYMQELLSAASQVGTFAMQKIAEELSDQDQLSDLEQHVIDHASRHSQ